MANSAIALLNKIGSKPSLDIEPANKSAGPLITLIIVPIVFLAWVAGLERIPFINCSLLIFNNLPAKLSFTNFCKTNGSPWAAASLLAKSANPSKLSSSKAFSKSSWVKPKFWKVSSISLAISRITSDPPPFTSSALFTCMLLAVTWPGVWPVTGLGAFAVCLALKALPTTVPALLSPVINL